MKKCLIFLLTAALAFSLSAGAFAGEAVISAPTETAQIEVVLGGNTGIRALGIDVFYDTDALTLENAKDADAGLLPGALFVQNVKPGVCSFAWACAEASDANGTVLRLTFSAKDAKGDFPVRAAVKDASTTDENGKSVKKTVELQTVLVGGGGASVSETTVGAPQSAAPSVSDAEKGGSGGPGPVTATAASETALSLQTTARRGETAASEPAFRTTRPEESGAVPAATGENETRDAVPSNDPQTAAAQTDARDAVSPSADGEVMTLAAVGEAVTRTDAPQRENKFVFPVVAGAAAFVGAVVAAVLVKKKKAR